MVKQAMIKPSKEQEQIQNKNKSRKYSEGQKHRNSDQLQKNLTNYTAPKVDRLYSTFLLT